MMNTVFQPSYKSQQREVEMASVGQDGPFSPTAQTKRHSQSLSVSECSSLSPAKHKAAGTVSEVYPENSKARRETLKCTWHRPSHRTSGRPDTLLAPTFHEVIVCFHRSTELHNFKLNVSHNQFGSGLLVFFNFMFCLKEHDHRLIRKIKHLLKTTGCCLNSM